MSFFEKLFSDIEEKVHLLAKITFVLGIILSAIMIILSFFGAPLLILAITLVISSYISSIMLYAFGDLILYARSIAQNSRLTADYTRALLKNSNEEKNNETNN